MGSRTGQVIRSLGGGTGTPSAASRSVTRPNYTRHTSNAIFSLGTGFNFLGSQAHFGGIWQPGSTMFMAGAIATAVGKLVQTWAKLAIPSTIYNLGSGTFVNSMFRRLLMSEGMAEGVRIVQRRRQAQLGLGPEYTAAQTRADELASDYGLERSTVLSSINVLSGLKVGSTGQRLGIGTATAITRIGGLIAQQSGRPFETVMTNMQQLLAQAVPNLRDIRELINQAPILGRYALDEMEKRGVKGMSNLEWLKSDQSNILSVLRRYDVENPTSTIMQARGMVTIANQNFFAKLAENPRWLDVAVNATRFMDALGDAVNKLLSAFTNNAGFVNSINALTLALDKLVSEQNVEKVANIMNGIAESLGLDVAGVSEEAKKMTQQRFTVGTAFDYHRERVYQQWLAAGLGSPSATDAMNREAFSTFYENARAKAYLDNALLGRVEFGSFGLPPMMREGWLGEGAFAATSQQDRNAWRREKSQEFARRNGGAGAYYLPYMKWSWPTPGFYADRSILPQASFDEYIAQQLARAGARDAVGEFGGLGGGASATGDDIRGFNRDRRSLEIHFHDAIVKWDSTIVTDDPQEVVDEVADNIEGAASRAIQIALLGASQKASTRWY